MTIVILCVSVLTLAVVCGIAWFLWSVFIAITREDE